MTLKCSVGVKGCIGSCHDSGASSSLVHCSTNALMAEGFMHLTLNQAIKVRVLIGVQSFKFMGMKLKWYIAGAC